MNTEEKILAILEEHSKMFQKMQGDIAGLKDGQAQMQGDIAGLKAGQTAMQGDITGIKVSLDYDVDVRLKALTEGQEAIEKRLDTLDEVKVLAEETRDKVDVIHAVVAQHSGAITELRQAK